MHDDDNDDVKNQEKKGRAHLSGATHYLRDFVQSVVDSLFFFGFVIIISLQFYQTYQCLMFLWDEKRERKKSYAPTRYFEEIEMFFKFQVNGK